MVCSLIFYGVSLLNVIYIYTYSCIYKIVKPLWTSGLFSYESKTTFIVLGEAGPNLLLIAHCSCRKLDLDIPVPNDSTNQPLTTTVAW